MFLHRRADHPAKKRFRYEARFRMVARSRSQRTTVAANNISTFALLEPGRSPEVGEDAERDINALLAGLAFYFREVLVRHLAPVFSHSGH